MVLLGLKLLGELSKNNGGIKPFEFTTKEMLELNKLGPAAKVSDLISMFPRFKAYIEHNGLDETQLRMFIFNEEDKTQLLKKMKELEKEGVMLFTTCVTGKEVQDNLSPKYTKDNDVDANPSIEKIENSDIERDNV